MLVCAANTHSPADLGNHRTGLKRVHRMVRMSYVNSMALAVLLLALMVIPAAAQEPAVGNMDEILQGFEEDAPADPGLEELMNGFEPAPAREPPAADGLDELMKGFESEPPAADRHVSQSDLPGGWDLEGDITLTAIGNIASDAVSPWRDLTMLRPELTLAVDNRFNDRWQVRVGARGFYDAVYSLRGRDNYPAPVRDEYEQELDLRDTYLQGRLTRRLDIKIGRQIVVWGTLDNLRVTDVLNPLDLRLPGLTDVEDLRLPVTMAVLDYYIGDWNVTAMAIPEVRFSKRPVFGSDFFPSPAPLPPEDVPGDGLENMQVAAAATGVFSGWDIAFYAADRYEDTPYVEMISPGRMLRRHARSRMLGTAANLAAGNWLFKGEAAWVDGIRFTNVPDADFSRTDVGAGIEYSGFSETTLSLEAVDRCLADYDERLTSFPDEIRRHQFQWAARVTRDFANDTLTLTALATTFGANAEDGAFERLEVEYDITDAVSIRGGVVLYQSGDLGYFKDVDANDRVFAECTYSF